MANNIENTIWAGSEADFKALLAALKWKGSLASYEALCPMPPSLNIEDRGEYEREQAKAAWAFVQSSSARVPAYLKRLHMDYEASPDHPRTPRAFRAWLLLEKQDILRYGRRLAENKKRYGHETWYSWRIANWGVKWDINEDDLEINFTTFMIRWESPWSAPIPIIRMLSEKVPQVNFEHEWCDLDDTKGWYTQEWSGGEVISEDFEPDPEYEEEMKRQEEADRRGEAIGEAMYRGW